MEVLRPAAGDDGDRRAGTAAVLGLEVRGLHADLTDGVQRGCRVVAAVRSGVLVGDAVVGEVERRAAVDRQAAAHRAPAGRFAVRRIDDARQQLQHAGDVASLQGDIFDVVARDHARARRGRRLHGDGFGLDRNRLCHAADFERDRAKPNPFGRREGIPFCS